MWGKKKEIMKERMNERKNEWKKEEIEREERVSWFSKYGSFGLAFSLC